MNTYWIDKQPFYFASKAEELSPQVFTTLAILLQSPMDRNIVKMLMALALFVGNQKISEKKARKPVFFWRKGYWDLKKYVNKRLSEDQLSEIPLFADWVFDDNVFIFNPLSLLKKGFFGKYYGIETFTQLSFWEFVNTDRCYSSYLQTQDLKHLDELIAIIYRPRNPKANPKKANYKGDLREDYNDYTVEQRLGWASKLPLSVKSAIILFYHQSFSEFAARYDQTVFKKTAKKGNESGNMGFVNAFYRLAENVTNLENTGKEKVEVVIYKLHLDIENQQKQAQS